MFGFPNRVRWLRDKLTHNFNRFAVNWVFVNDKIVPNLIFKTSNPSGRTS